MKNPCAAIFVCFIFLGACTQENKNTFEDIKIKNALCQNITLQQMDMHYLLGNPSKLCIKDSLLFISDFIKGKFITVYNLANKDSLFSTLHEGRGPNEVIGPIDVSFPENNLVVLDRQKAVFRHFSLDLSSENPLLCTARIQLPFGTDRGIYLSRDSSYFVGGFFQDGLLKRYNSKGDEIASYNPCADFIKTISDPSMRYRLGQSHIATIQDKLVLASSFTGEIRFFDIKSDSLYQYKYYTINRKEIFDKIRQRVSKSDFQIYQSDIVGIKSIYTTNNHVYIAFNNNTIANRAADDNNYLLKFNRKGDLIKIYETDRKFLCMAITPDDHDLYTVILNDKQEAIIAHTNLD